MNWHYHMLGIVRWKKNNRIHSEIEPNTLDQTNHPAQENKFDSIVNNQNGDSTQMGHLPIQNDIAQIETNSESILSQWQSLQSRVSQCTACSLHQSRTQTVFGVGNRDAKLMFIGEAPGFYEDQQGEPFVGRAGQLLNAMLAAIGLNRTDIYIANILKCRPPNNRDPNPDEVKTCTTFLDQQIALVNPTLLIALGRIAAHYLLKTKSSLESLRNQLHHYGDQKIPLIITYHPAYLLRNPKDKKKAYLDLQFTEQTLSLHAKA
jgi:uracil-DNA glycosylase family 4